MHPHTDTDGLAIKKITDNFHEQTPFMDAPKEKWKEKLLTNVN